MEKTIEYVFSGESSGELYRTTSLVNMYNTSKEIKEFDRKNYIRDNYYYEIEETTGEKNEKGQLIIYVRNVKIYKRGNKIFCKSI